MKFKKYLTSLIIFAMMCTLSSIPVFAEEDVASDIVQTESASEEAGVDSEEAIASENVATAEVGIQAAASRPFISASNQTVHNKGARTVTPITTGGAGNLGALEFDVEYDSTALAQMAVNISQGVHCKTNIVGNTISYAFANATGVDLSKVCELVFNVNATSAVTIKSVKAWNSSGQPVSLEVKSGAVTLDTNIPRGDANGDYKIDIYDILLIQDYILGRTNPTPITTAADMNGDGVVNVSDIVSIQNHILGRK